MLLKHPCVNQSKALQPYTPHALTWSFVLCAAVIIVIKRLKALEFPLLWLTHQAESDENAPHECELIIFGFTHTVNTNIEWTYLSSVPHLL